MAIWTILIGGEAHGTMGKVPGEALPSPPPCVYLRFFDGMEGPVLSPLFVYTYILSNFFIST
jgi:hypothetical protein